MPQGDGPCSAARVRKKFLMTVFSALNAVLVKKSPVQGVSQTLGLLVLVVKKSQAAETLVLSLEKPSVNNETWGKAKQVDFLPKYSNKSPWVSSNNQTFHKANSLLSRACLTTKWASSHLKAFPATRHASQPNGSIPTSRPSAPTRHASQPNGSIPASKPTTDQRRGWCPI